ncbi:hypothetical protein GGF32_005685 [Allomyces javanicus]|nr:hypothetical protein GGF32_005685 [Allomyces javanicus]
MPTITTHRASTAKAAVSTNKQMLTVNVNSPQPRTMLIEIAHMDAFIGQLDAAISDYRYDNPYATLNWTLIKSLEKLKQDMEKAMRDGATLEANTSASGAVDNTTVVSPPAAAAASGSSTTEFRYSTAVPSGKTTADAVNAIAVHEATDEMPRFVRPFLKNVHRRRMLAHENKVVEPGKTKRDMPKVDVVVIKGGQYFYAVGWLALFVPGSKFGDYEHALKEMRKAINKDMRLCGSGEKEGLAIKAGNYRMWMVTIKTFKELLWPHCTC